MLGNAVSSSTPIDFHPSSTMGVADSRPLMNFHALPGPAIGCPYDAVEMQRALASTIGLPRRASSASWMLGFLMPAEVRSNRTIFLPDSLLSHAGTTKPSCTLGTERGRRNSLCCGTANPTRNTDPLPGANAGRPGASRRSRYPRNALGQCDGETHRQRCLARPPMPTRSALTWLARSGQQMMRIWWIDRALTPPPCDH